MSKIRKIRDFFALERNIIVIGITNLLFIGGFSLWSSFLPKFFQSLGASAIIVGLLFSLESGLQTFFHVIGGHLSDKYGRKKIYVLSIFMSALVILAYYLSTYWLMLLPVLLLSSAADGIGGTAGSTVIIESTPKNKRSTGWSIVQATANITSLVTVPIGAYIIDIMGFTGGFKLCLIISIALTVLSGFFLNSFLLETLKKRKDNVKFKIQNTFSFYKKIPSKMKYYFLFIGLMFFSTSLTIRFEVLYILDYIKLSVLEFGIIASVGLVSATIFSLVGGKLSDKHGRKVIILAAVAMYAITSVLFVVSSNFLQFIFVYVISGACIMSYPSIMPYIADHMKSDRSKAIGLANAIMIVSSAPAPFVGGILFTIAPTLPFIALSLLMAVTFIVGWKILK
jgi:MFS family permease